MNICAITFIIEAILNGLLKIYLQINNCRNKVTKYRELSLTYVPNFVILELVVI
jgi:hypothetical protein